MDISTVSDNSLNLQSLLMNGINETRSNNGTAVKNVTNDKADYAKKGEPTYMAEMDSDGDGTVSFDEFREYCKEKNISSKQMVKMSQLASSYRTLKAEENTIDYISKLTPNVFPKLKQADSESGAFKNSENKYNISNDTNYDRKVSYNEYMSYCEQNVKPNEIKVNAKIEETDSNNFKISKAGYAVKSYETNSAYKLKSTFEESV